MDHLDTKHAVTSYIELFNMTYVAAKALSSRSLWQCLFNDYDNDNLQTHRKHYFMGDMTGNRLDMAAKIYSTVEGMEIRFAGGDWAGGC